ncbi:lantibiotic dehydratase [Streptomyces hoynatensis]|uniref:Lantibiotic dehydratase n=1 Tax=Streptomyces hoynatensis TaxID=1141874 RepID=A0A3A9Z6X8_9ACTN|nr:lantibiotic dehydratase [Streptomyces hoynatensis]RKN43990.1 lantibiotic dehydratase [Streptomyces hoynatensis]
MTGEAVLSGRTRTPGGTLRYALHPVLLLRPTGFDVGPLSRLGGPTPLRDAPDAAEEEVRAEYERALERAVAATRAAFTPRMREAVSLSGPSFYRLAFGPGRTLVTDEPWAAMNSGARGRMRTAHRYLRRLLAKTETVSFYGPVLVASFDPFLDQPLRVGEPGPEECTLRLSHWVVRDLAQSLRRTRPAGDRAWARDPLWRREGGDLRCVLTGRRIPLGEEAALVWEALAGPLTPRQLAGRCGAPRAVAAALARLAPALRPWPQPASTETHGVRWLREQHPDSPLVAELEALLGTAAQASWPASLQARQRVRERVARAGCATERAGGSHYADRDVVNEDRSSPFTGRVAFGAPAARSLLGALEAVLPVMTLAALLAQADAREAVVRATGGRRVGLVELVAREVPPVTERREALSRVLAACVDGVGGEEGEDRGEPGGVDELRLDPEELAARLAPLWSRLRPAEGEQWACWPGFDLMVAGGPPGGGQWVLSECHDDSSTIVGGFTADARPGGTRDFLDFCARLPGWLDTGRMATVVGRRRNRHITPELPGLSIELSGVSAKPPEQVVPACAVEVAADGASVLHGGRRYQLYPGDLGSVVARALSLPCLVPVDFAPGRRRAPRVVLGGMVVQRRRWRLPLPPLGRGLAGWRAARVWQRAEGMPDQVFLRHPRETKPLLVDFTDPLGVDDLCRLPGAEVTCSEVLPGLRDTWWNVGARQPAELRVPVFVRWEPADAALAG